MDSAAERRLTDGTRAHEGDASVEVELPHDRKQDRTDKRPAHGYRLATMN